MQTGLERIAEYCESSAEEARAGNLQVGFCEGCAPGGARLLDRGGEIPPRHSTAHIKSTPSLEDLSR
jgi:hypothetical protein